MRVHSHKLVFSIPPQDWQESFPIGNGHLGGTVYQPKGRWEWVLNHLDVVTAYHHLSRESDIYTYPIDDAEIRRRALEAHDDRANIAHQDYNQLFGSYGGSRAYAGQWEPICCTVQVSLGRV